METTLLAGICCPPRHRAAREGAERASGARKSGARASGTRGGVCGTVSSAVPWQLAPQAVRARVAAHLAQPQFVSTFLYTHPHPFGPVLNPNLLFGHRPRAPLRYQVQHSGFGHGGQTRTSTSPSEGTVELVRPCMCRAARLGLVLRWLVVLGTTPTRVCVPGTTVIWVGWGTT